MRPRLKHILVAFLALLLLTFAYSPLLSAGLLASDTAVLIRGQVELGLGPVASDGIAKPLTSLSIELSRVLFGLPTTASGDVVGFFVRAENLLWHLVAALALGRYARRLLMPWSGSEQAGAAARAATLLFALHPLAVPAVASLAARGDLIALALSLASAAAFMRGRQDRRLTGTVSALLFAILAGLASDLALGLPVLLAVSELTSSHRYRPLRIRLRTSFTTLVIFGAGASIDLAFHLFRLGTDGLPPSVRGLFELGSIDALTSAAHSTLEKLGLLVLPANPGVLGIAGIAIAGVVFLLAMQPALVAARSAPRLWGWQLIGWFIALIVSQFMHIHVQVTGETFGLARVLLPSAAVMAVGLGIAATAISGSRRPYIAWAVALGYAIVAHGNALPWRTASADAALLRVDMQAARSLHPDVPLFVIDPPQPVHGVVVAGDAIGYLDHPALSGGSGEREVDARGVSLAAFLAFVVEPEFSEAVRSGLVVLYPRAETGARHVRLIAAPTPTVGTRAWRGSLNSPQLDLDCLSESALRVTVPSGVDPKDLARISWRTPGDDEPNRGSIEGSWRSVGDEHVGVFDFSSSLDWRLGGRVRTLVFEDGTQSIDTAEITTDLPSLGSAAPRTRGEDWVFVRPDDKVAPIGGEFFLAILDLTQLTLVELEVEVGDESLRAPGAASVAAEVRSAGSLVWILDYRIAGRAVARSRGRR